MCKNKTFARRHLRQSHFAQVRAGHLYSTVIQPYISTYSFLYTFLYNSLHTKKKNETKTGKTGKEKKDIQISLTKINTVNVRCVFRGVGTVHLRPGHTHALGYCYKRLLCVLSVHSSMALTAILA